MGLYIQRPYMYNKMPLAFNNDREEDFLIEVPGNWIPECDIVYWGLLNSEYAETLYKLRENPVHDQHRAYMNTCFFTAPDLVRYLSSTDDKLDKTLTDYEIGKMLDAAFEAYDYSPANETMLRHSIMEIMYDSFVRSVTLAYPWKIRPMDVAFLRLITPQKIFSKLNLVEGTPESVMRTSGVTFTTVVMNSLTDLERMVDHRTEYHCEATLFILRNHSGNMKMTFNEDTKEYDFEEIGMETLLPKLFTESAIPLTQIRFGRYEPELYKDALRRIPGFSNV